MPLHQADIIHPLEHRHFARHEKRAGMSQISLNGPMRRKAQQAVTIYASDAHVCYASHITCSADCIYSDLDPSFRKAKLPQGFDFTSIQWAGHAETLFKFRSQLRPISNHPRSLINMNHQSDNFSSSWIVVNQIDHHLHIHVLTSHFLVYFSRLAYVGHMSKKRSKGSLCFGDMVRDTACGRNAASSWSKENSALKKV